MDRMQRLTRLLEADPRDPFVLYAIAQEHARAGRTADAVAFFDRCIEADPANAYAHFHKARALEADGQHAAALQAARAGLAAAHAAADHKALAELQALVASLS
jgi:tetratricopeptide (TPR) repeat protein